MEKTWLWKIRNNSECRDTPNPSHSNTPTVPHAERHTRHRKGKPRALEDLNHACSLPALFPLRKQLPFPLWLSRPRSLRSNSAGDWWGRCSLLRSSGGLCLSNCYLTVIGCVFPSIVRLKTPTQVLLERQPMWSSFWHIRSGNWMTSGHSSLFKLSVYK